MLEKDIENLLARYPNEFFGGEDLELIGQQITIFARRMDIVFKDKHGRKIIVEVKRGILTREASGQIAEYYGLMKQEDEDQICELVLCANIIPKERAKFLEAIGIECLEVGIARLSSIAMKYGYTFLDSESQESENINSKPNEERIDTSEINGGVWIFQANPSRYDILNALGDSEIGNKTHWLVNQHKAKIKQGDLALLWMSGSEAGIYGITRVECNPMLLAENEAEKKYWLESGTVEMKLRVRLTMLRNLVNTPLLKSRIQSQEGLENLSILRQHQGTNFPVSTQEWDIISSMI